MKGMPNRNRLDSERTVTGAVLGASRNNWPGSMFAAATVGGADLDCIDFPIDFGREFALRGFTAN
jgi:hypothetical protein